MYVYIKAKPKSWITTLYNIKNKERVSKSENKFWAVGYFSPDGKWHLESEHRYREHAIARVRYLNGGPE